MSFAVTLSSPSSSSSSSSSFSQSKTRRSNPNPNSLTIQILPPNKSIQASKRSISNSTDNNNINSFLANDTRNWSRSIKHSDFFYDEINGDDEDDDDDDEEEDRSLDLLVRFIQNIFKKASKRARKAVRSVLPHPISTKLVGFSVNGVLILAFLWVLKAFLEVVCTLGTAVFVSILLIRGVWSGITYLQESRYRKMNELEDDHHEWTGAQPAT